MASIHKKIVSIRIFSNPIPEIRQRGVNPLETMQERIVFNCACESTRGTATLIVLVSKSSAGVRSSLPDLERSMGSRRRF